jgi:hypothetical protein
VSNLVRRQSSEKGLNRVVSVRRGGARRSKILVSATCSRILEWSERARTWESARRIAGQAINL